MLPLGCLQLPVVYSPKVPLVILTAFLEFGPFEGDLMRRHLSALLQLDVPVAKALALCLKRLPHSHWITTLVSSRIRWVQDNTHGRGTGAASCSAPDRSCRPMITSTSFRVGKGSGAAVPTGVPTQRAPMVSVLPIPAPTLRVDTDAQSEPYLLPWCPPPRH